MLRDPRRGPTSLPRDVHLYGGAAKVRGEALDPQIDKLTGYRDAPDFATFPVVLSAALASYLASQTAPRLLLADAAAVDTTRHAEQLLGLWLAPFDVRRDPLDSLARCPTREP